MEEKFKPFKFPIPAEALVRCLDETGVLLCTPDSSEIPERWKKYVSTYGGNSAIYILHKPEWTESVFLHEGSQDEKISFGLPSRTPRDLRSVDGQSRVMAGQPGTTSPRLRATLGCSQGK